MRWFCWCWSPESSRSRGASLDRSVFATSPRHVAEHAMIDDLAPDNEEYDDCADEGVVLDGPAAILRALIDAEPSPPTFKSALWRGLVGGGALDHRADTVAGLTPKPY